VGPKRRHRPIDLLEVLATLIVLAVIVGQIVMLSGMFSENRPKRVKLDAARTSSTDQGGTQLAGPSVSAAAAVAVSRPPAAAQPPAEPAVLNHMIRIVRADRNDSGDTVNITIQTKAQVGERELDTAAVAICVQFAAVDGAGLGVDWRNPVWLQIPAWENFTTKTFVVRFPGHAHEMVGYVVRTYYHQQMQDVSASQASLRARAPIPTVIGAI